MDNELYHHGIKGMRWGVRRSAKQLGHPTQKDKTKTKLKKIKEDTKNQEKIMRAQAKADLKLAKAKKKFNPTDANQKAHSSEQPKKRKLSELSDEELNARINRLRLEQTYKELMPKPVNEVKTSRGKKFAMDVLEQSGKNIATQTLTAIMGTAVNKSIGSLFNDPNFINPKKGQKDK